MIKLYMNKTIIRKSKIKNAGRGVFAICNIKKNEIIEKCQLIEISKQEINHLIPTILGHYHYEHKNKYAIALGNGSLYNCNRLNPNADAIDYKNFIILKALKDIKKNEQITFDYVYDIKWELLEEK